MRQLVAAAVLIVTGCTHSSPEISAQLAHLVSNQSVPSIDLAHLGPASWNRVCVLTPYTNNQHAARILGFDWDAEGKTGIYSSDSINILVFIQGKKVVAYTEHPRNFGDLAELQPLCLPRSDAIVVRRTTSDGWVYLVSRHAA